MHVKVYLHGDKEYLYQVGYGLGLRDRILKEFSYSCYEIEVLLKVDPQTGQSEIVNVDGKDLIERIK